MNENYDELTFHTFESIITDTKAKIMSIGDFDVNAKIFSSIA